MALTQTFVPVQAEQLQTGTVLPQLQGRPASVNPKVSDMFQSHHQKYNDAHQVKLLGLLWMSPWDVCQFPGFALARPSLRTVSHTTASSPGLYSRSELHL